MRVLHAAVFSDGQVFAGRLQLFHAHGFALAAFQALGSGFMGGGHGAVARDVFLGFLIRVGLCQGGSAGQQQGMHQTVQRIQGFMVPMDAKPTQKHFLLTSVPLTCSFCIPGGPESMVEVKAKTPVRYSLEPVVVEGKFNVLPNDPYGLFYRLVEAVPVK